MKAGFDVTHLDDATIHGMFVTLRRNGFEMEKDFRENDRYLSLEAPSEEVARELLSTARRFCQKQELQMVFWNEELGMYMNEEDVAKERRRQHLAEVAEEWGGRARDPLGSDHAREELDYTS